MSFRERTGLDGFDVAIQAGITACLMGVFGTVGAEEMLYIVPAASLGVLGIRRKIAQRRGLVGSQAEQRLAELEERIGELDATQMRVMELEERLDFAERILAGQQAVHRIGDGER
ncbi:MAG TPA: hypothetical protein VF037_00620 [Gemmatimonadales bacterium]